MTVRKRPDRFATPPVSEADWQAAVMDYARLTGWLCTHVTPSLSVRGRHLTATSGSPGLPDLMLLHRVHGAAFAELKSDTGRPTADQQMWIAAGAMLWRPRDKQRVFAFLRTGVWLAEDGAR